MDLFSIKIVVHHLRKLREMMFPALLKYQVLQVDMNSKKTQNRFRTDIIC